MRTASVTWERRRGIKYLSRETGFTGLEEESRFTPPTIELPRFDAMEYSPMSASESRPMRLVRTWCGDLCRRSHVTQKPTDGPRCACAAASRPPMAACHLMVLGHHWTSIIYTMVINSQQIRVSYLCGLDCGKLSPKETSLDLYFLLQSFLYQPVTCNFLI